MKRVVRAVWLFGCLLVCASALQLGPSEYSSRAVAAFKSDAKTFAAAAGDLKKAVETMREGDETSRLRAIEALRGCRLRYKRIEAFMEYYFRYPVNLYNRAPVFEVEEPYMEYQSPVGLQYIESLLTEPNAFENKKEILDQCEVVYTSATDIPSLLYDFKVEDAALLEATRLELVRIITLGITGYDAPQLKSGIGESAVALQAMQESLEPLLAAHGSSRGERLRQGLQAAIDYLNAHPGFDGFNRLEFLTTTAFPLQHQLSDFITDTGLDTNAHPALSHKAAHLLSRDALRLEAFSDRAVNANEVELAAIGKKLFFEKALSGNGSRSCATCHQPEKFFTDGRVKSLSLDGKTEVQRNAPSLYYVAYQRSQFHDGRAGSLEEQVKTVLQSPLEMDAHLDTVVSRVNETGFYKRAFAHAWPTLSRVGIEHIAAALAAYERTLAPFSSPFDRYIAGDATAMRAEARRGFNLFMGKAQCGTCHFAPLFNGLLPPYYEVSEMEVLGVPQRTRGKKQRLDTDSGRYHFFPISFNNGAFKTTTVRNVAKTAPYMHNGAFRTLEEVIDFYNQGGGRGLGLNVEMQTLSDKPLGLTKEEIRDVVAFLEALTDAPATVQ